MRSRARLLVGVVFVWLLAIAVSPRAAGGRVVPADSHPLVVQAFTSAFSLDYDKAIVFARQAVAAAPGDPAAHRALASVIWLDLLFLRGAVTVDYYLGGVTKTDLKMSKPPADLDAEFRREIAEATRLADARLAQNKKDIQALYDSGAAYGVLASYTASIEGRVKGAFSPARKAFDAHETVLDKDPSRVEANLTVGTYRYIVACQSLPTRLLAYIAGFGGDKARGIRMMEMAAASGPMTADAKFALILIYTREQRYADGLRVIGELEARFPDNRLLRLEEGAMHIRAGHQFEAEAVLTRGLAGFETDTRPKFPGERALWLAKRGTARVALNHRADAAADLSAALAAGPMDWVRGRILVEQGKLADLEGRRADALARYREGRKICEDNRDPTCETEAGRLMKKPFTMGNPR